MFKSMIPDKENTDFNDINEKNYYGHVLSLNKDDKRLKKFKKQRLDRGFDDSETWSLDETTLRFFYPRFKRFKELTIGYPANLSEKKWNKILNKIEKSLEWKINHHNYFKPMPKEIEIGFKFLIKYFNTLWW